MICQKWLKKCVIDVLKLPDGKLVLGTVHLFLGKFYFRLDFILTEISFWNLGPDFVRLLEGNFENSDFLEHPFWTGKLILFLFYSFVLILFSFTNFLFFLFFFLINSCLLESNQLE